MTKPRRKRRILRKLITALTLLTVAGYTASAWVTMNLVGPPNIYSIDSGLLVVQRFICIEGDRISIERHRLTGFEFQIYRAIRGPEYFDYRIALWPIPALLISTCIIWYWRDWRNGCRSGFCRKCGYNLAGNVSGHCPECGTSTEPKPA